MSFNHLKLNKLPKKPGVYFMRDADEKILYIGKAKSLYHRIRQYFFSYGDQRAMIPFLIKKISSIETIITFNEKEALLLERSLIQTHQPPYNVVLKDDKNFSGIELDQSEIFPTIKLTRYDPTKKKTHFFGPYTSSKGARILFDFLKRTFPLRKCSLNEFKSRKTPCIYYNMHQCKAPCVQKCLPEEYQKDVELTLLFLQTKDKKPLKKLKIKREEASQKEQFEKAQEYHQQLTLINQLLSEGHTQTHSSKNPAVDIYNYCHNDEFLALIKLKYRNHKLEEMKKYQFRLNFSDPLEVITSFLMQHYERFPLPKEILLPQLFTHQTQSLSEALCETTFYIPLRGEKKKHLDFAYINAKSHLELVKKGKKGSENILLDLQEFCLLRTTPMHIECFDTSHTMQQTSVGSKAVFIDGQENRSLCRSYHIKKPGDDISMLYGVIKKSLLRAEKENTLPDLIIIDGGKGHLNMLTALIEELNIVSIDCIAIAKENSRHDQGLTKEKIYTPYLPIPLILSKYSPLLMFLQNIRDAAHNRAISFHRKSSRKLMIASELDQIPGIGPTKKKRLLTRFKSIQEILNASDEELLEVPAVTSSDLKNLRNFLKKP